MISLPPSKTSTHFSSIKNKGHKKNKGNSSFLLRVKTDIDRNTILDLKEEIDALKVNVQKATVHIEDLLRDNTAMKRMCDARSTEIQNLRYEIKAVESKNERSN